jgi:AcrR family transcriptional regulator
MRQEIINTSLEGFLKHGIREMTVQKLVGPLGISTKTVYKYFSNKEDLLRECLSVHYSGLFKQTYFTGDQYPNPAIALENLWQKAFQIDFGVNSIFYHDLNHYYPELQDEILKKHGGKIETTIVKLIKEGMYKGYFLKDLQPRLIFEAMTVIYRSLTRTEDFKKFRVNPKDLVRQTVHIYLRGICTSKGLSELTS